MKIENKIEVIELYEIYGKLLNEKQKEVFELYYYEDMSIIEICEDKDVSKNAVYKVLKKAEEKIIEFENTLKIHENKKNNLQLLRDNNVDESIVQKIK